MSTCSGSKRQRSDRKMRFVVENDLSTSAVPTQHGVGVLLLQISRCRPSKQYLGLFMKCPVLPRHLSETWPPMGGYQLKLVGGVQKKLGGVEKSLPQRDVTFHKVRTRLIRLVLQVHNNFYNKSNYDNTSAKHLTIESFTVVMLLTFMLIIISISHPSLFDSRLKTFLFCISFPL